MNSVSESQIYVMQEGRKLGPYGEQQALQLLQKGTFLDEDLAWCKGQREWQPLANLLADLNRLSPPPANRSLSSLRRRRIKSRMVTVVIALIVVYLGSPYYAVWRLQSAFKSGDIDELESRIDFPSVRESLKDQLKAYVSKNMSETPEMKDNPFAGLATAFAPMMVSYAVDKQVTPSGIAALIADSKATYHMADDQATEPTPVKPINWSKVRYFFFTSPTRFLLDVDGKKMRFGFTGFGWQVKKIEIPDFGRKPDSTSPSAASDAQ